MKKSNYKPQIPDLMEAVFDAVYLTFDLAAAALFFLFSKGNMKLSVIRNAVFAVTGIGVMILYLISGNTYGYHMTRMAAAIMISFGCYLPVTLFSKTKPQVGLLMIPKTCAYMWIIVMGLQLLF